MRTLRTMGVVGTAATLLFTATLAFAETGPGERSGEGSGRVSRIVASSTMERVQEMREEARDRVEGEREKAAKRLSDVRDKGKQEMAKRLAVQFDDLNLRWTNRFAETLDRYDVLVKKIQVRADINAADGKDATRTVAAIQAATVTIADARTAVLAQAAKTYVLDTSAISATATSTSSGQEKIVQDLRKSFAAMHKALFKDLFALRDGPMKDARKAVQDAIQTIGKISGGGDGQATSTEKKSDTNSN